MRSSRLPFGWVTEQLQLRGVELGSTESLEQVPRRFAAGYMDNFTSFRLLPASCGSSNSY